MITVRRAIIKDIPMIMQFLDEHWLKGYALAHNRDLFNWQFVRGDKVNIWIGVDDDNKKMYAMQGGIIYRSGDHADVSGMLWIAIKSNNPLLAMEVGDAMYKELCPRNTFSIGLLKDAVKVLKRVGKKIVYCDHYYRLADKEQYEIAVIKEKIIPHVQDYGYTLKEFTDLSTFKEIITEKTLIESSPSKDYNYIEWRYWNHPVFNYHKWFICDNEGKKVSVLITREENYNNCKTCKIIDYYGDENSFSKIGKEIDRIMIDNRYEYIDVYSYGISEQVYKSAGFIKCDASSQNIITNLFQPYVAQNTDLALIEPVENTRLFRGDSDQDKPRLIL